MDGQYLVDGFSLLRARAIKPVTILVVMQSFHHLLPASSGQDADGTCMPETTEQAPLEP
jgi:hypothetical protein